MVDSADVLEGHVYLETKGKVDWDARFRLDEEVRLVQFWIGRQTLDCLEKGRVRLVEVRVGESDRKTCKIYEYEYCM